jgi:hypothetical protein
MDKALEELMEREYQLASRDIERGAAVCPYILAQTVSGEDYLIPFQHVIDDERMKAAWTIAFKLFASMTNMSRYVVVSEAWSYRVEVPADKKVDLLEYAQKHSERQEILSVAGVSHEVKRSWTSSIVRDGSLIVCDERNRHEEATESSGILLDLLPPKILCGTMPEQVRFGVYEAMKKAAFVFISR